MYEFIVNFGRGGRLSAGQSRQEESRTESEKHTTRHEAYCSASGGYQGGNESHTKSKVRSQIEEVKPFAKCAQPRASSLRASPSGLRIRIPFRRVMRPM